MAALDDIVGCIVFFTTIAIVAGNLSAGSLPAYMIALVVVLPLIIGAVCGFISGDDAVTCHYDSVYFSGRLLFQQPGDAKTGIELYVNRYGFLSNICQYGE